jgi:hypothetical protein
MEQLYIFCTVWLALMMKHARHSIKLIEGVKIYQNVAYFLVSFPHGRQVTSRIHIIQIKDRKDNEEIVE